MSDIHEGVVELLAARRGEIGLRVVLASPRQTGNQGTVADATGLVMSRRALEQGSPVILEHVARPVLRRLAEELRDGLFFGEGPDNYSSLHAIGRLVALQEAATCTAIAKATPAVWRNDALREDLLALGAGLVSWWRQWDTLTTAWRARNGVFRVVGPRVKGGTVEESQLTGGDVYQAVVHEPPDQPLHPYIARRMGQPLTHRWWSELNPHPAVLRGLLAEEASRKLLDAIVGPPVPVRLAYRAYWRDVDGYLVHLVAPDLPGLNDSDGTLREAKEGFWRFDPGSKAITWQPLAAQVGKGFNGRFEVRCDAATGDLLGQVWYRGVQAVPGRATRVPHPLSSAEGFAEMVAALPHSTSDAPVRIDDLPGADLSEIAPSIARPPVRPRPVAQWRIRQAMATSDGAKRDSLAHLAWQAQRWADGEPQSEDDLIQAVEAFRATWG